MANYVTQQAANFPTYQTPPTATVAFMVASGPDHASGSAPDPGAVAGTTKYLREDATWAAPATGSANIKETEVDFGNVVSRTEQTFTITDADVSAGSQLLAQILHKAPSDARSVDEIQCEQFDILCAPAAGTFDMTMRGRSGSVMGKFIVAYLVG